MTPDSTVDPTASIAKVLDEKIKDWRTEVEKNVKNNIQNIIRDAMSDLIQRQENPGNNNASNKWKGNEQRRSSEPRTSGDRSTAPNGKPFLNDKGEIY